MDPILEVKGLYKVFGEDPERAFSLIEKGIDKDGIFEQTGLTVGVNDVSLTINEGEIFVIMGLSGSGKSTLVRLLNRLIEPTKGSVYLKGKDIAHISEDELREVRRNNISMVFQSFALMPHMTVIENAAFGLELAGIDVNERQKSALSALERVGLDPYAESFPDEVFATRRPSFVEMDDTRYFGWAGKEDAVHPVYGYQLSETSEDSILSM